MENNTMNVIIAINIVNGVEKRRVNTMKMNVPTKNLKQRS